jgi:hypothetical protein
LAARLVADLNKNRPRRLTGSRRVRERFEAVEMPLKRTNQSQKARHGFLGSALIDLRLGLLDSWKAAKLQLVGGESAGDVFLGVALKSPAIGPIAQIVSDFSDQTQDADNHFPNEFK